MARNLKMVLAYNGAPFSGWQVQPDRSTVQGTLAGALEQITGEKILPQGSGRTDAGVHALAQVASCTTSSSIPSGNLVKAMNSMLPASIRVLSVEEVGEEFHARHSAKAKTYEYRLYRGEICPPFLADFVTHNPYPLDEGAMAAGAEAVVGEHDFTSFAAVDPEKRAPADAEEGTCGNVRTIYSSQWMRDGEELVYRVRGNGFLHHMVRNLVGTFLLVGRGTLKPDDIEAILAAKRRSAAGPTAPAEGLYLVSVEY
ncbi:MAG TPA: tRNA pseudouridine(38-40) synthase TruA [Terriglobales bacterium]|nr:tRNA pseudouridine(38-40) synthase TruA [Terriglobales bacterium]